MNTTQFLLALANRLDSWAEESQSGGGSTHQVEANRKAADDCQREAAQIDQAKETLSLIRSTIGEYYIALDRREDGGVAQDRAIKKIEKLLKMSWQ